MRERPILFSGPMVRAILEGRKTQTRRVCRDQTPVKYWHGESLPMIPDGKEKYTGWVKDVKNVAIGIPSKCPYGAPGDRLWVRETWKAEENIYESRPCIAVYFKASPDTGKVVLFEEDILPSLSSINKWKPSIHMFRWASRIDLEITAIRVERVQDISKTDCEAEGLKLLQGGILSEFAVLWDSINAKRGYPWKDNPWIWVVEFKVV